MKKTTPASTLDLDTLHLASGGHSSPDKGMCVMEAVAFMAKESFSDHPACACPVIAAVLRRWNDKLDDKKRQELKRYIVPLIGSKSTPEVERSRKFVIVDWSLRIVTVHFLRDAKLNEHAEIIEALPEIKDMATFKAVRPQIQAAREAAREARRVSKNPASLDYLASLASLDYLASLDSLDYLASLDYLDYPDYLKKTRAGLLASAHKNLFARMLAVKE